MDWNQIIITAITAVVPAIISYVVARYQGKNDIKKLNVENKAEIERLVKQHEINLEAIKEQHRLEMEAKEQEFNKNNPAFDMHISYGYAIYNPMEDSNLEQTRDRADVLMYENKRKSKGMK